MFYVTVGQLVSVGQVSLSHMSSRRVVSTLLALVLMINQSTEGKCRELHDLSGCMTNDDCLWNMACTGNTCVDPCEDNVCGKNALCHVSNHVTRCACKIGYAGHPFSVCVPAAPCITDCANETADITRTESNNKYHLYHNIKMNWYQSATHCNSLNMRLATINSQEEQDELVRLIKNTNTSRNWWLGGWDLGQLGDYEWMTSGRAMTFTNFNSPQPDNFVYYNGVVEHCIEVRPSWNYTWNDFVCDYHQYHVCEKYQVS